MDRHKALEDSNIPEIYGDVGSDEDIFEAVDPFQYKLETQANFRSTERRQMLKHLLGPTSRYRQSFGS